MSWRNYFISRKIRELSVQQKNRSGLFLPMNEVQHVLLMFNEEDEQELLPCIDKLKRMDKRVSLCIFSSENTTEDVNSMMVYTCCKKDQNFFYFPSQAFLQQINDVKADLIIDLTKPDNLTAQYVLLQHPCKFKAGFKREDIELYDLAIVVTDRKNLQHLFEQLLFYLNSIRSK